MKKIVLISLIYFISSTAFAQNLGISGVMDWETMQINSTVNLNLSSAGIRLPAGRTLAESIIQEGYTSLLRGAIYKLQVDSSSTVEDLFERGEITLPEIDAVIKTTLAVPPSLSSDMRDMSASYSVSALELTKLLQKHINPSPVNRVINPVTSPDYTGIIIIASERLPSWGMSTALLPVPCLFPKIWDSEMNLIYEKNMAEPALPFIKYSTPGKILHNTPSGLSSELEQIAGSRPLRIFARGVFGIKPTDLIIDRQDALLIISNEQNRRLLSQGKVVIILDDSVMKEEFSY